MKLFTKTMVAVFVAACSQITVFAGKIPVSSSDELPRITYEVREMQDKPADKLTSGLVTESVLLSLKSGNSMGSAAFLDTFKKD